MKSKKRATIIPENARLHKTDSSADTQPAETITEQESSGLVRQTTPEIVKETQESVRTTAVLTKDRVPASIKKSQANLYLSLDVLSVVDDLEYELRKKGVKTNRSLLTEEALQLLFEKYRKKGVLKV